MIEAFISSLLLSIAVCNIGINGMIFVKTVQLIFIRWIDEELEDVLLFGEWGVLFIYLSPPILTFIVAIFLGEHPLIPVIIASILPTFAFIIHGICYLIYRSGKKTN